MGFSLSLTILFYGEMSPIRSQPHSLSKTSFYLPQRPSRNRNASFRSTQTASLLPQEEHDIASQDLSPPRMRELKMQLDQANTEGARVLTFDVKTGEWATWFR